MKTEENTGRDSLIRAVNEARFATVQEADAFLGKEARMIECRAVSPKSEEHVFQTGDGGFIGIYGYWDREYGRDCPVKAGPYRKVPSFIFIPG